MKAARPKLKTLDRDFQEQLLKIVRFAAYGLPDPSGTARSTTSPGARRRPRGARRRSCASFLQKQNYVVKNLGLAQGLGREVPDDASRPSVCWAPPSPSLPRRSTSLKRYAEAGGKLYIALDPDAPQTTEDTVSPLGGAEKPDEPAAAGDAPPKPGEKKPAPEKKPGEPKQGGEGEEKQEPEPPRPLTGLARGLDALAGVVGLTFRPDLLANDRQHLRRRFNESDRTLIFSNRFSSHASVSTLSRNSARAAVVVSGAGSLTKAGGGQEKVDFTVRSVSGTFGDVNKNYTFDKGAEKREQYNMAAAVSRASSKKPPEPKKDDKKKGAKKEEGPAPPDEMRAFVVADADALTDIVMSNVVANQVFFVDAIRWLGGEESFAGEVNSEEDVSIEHTKQKDLVWFYATIFGAPALVLGAGIWYSRRSRRNPRGKK